MTCEILFLCVPAALDIQSLGSDSVTINGLVPIIYPAPIVKITGPLNGTNFTVGNLISFRSTVTVASGLALDSIKWVSSRDGQLSTSEDFDTSALTTGAHTITATATDSKGQTASVSLTINVNPVVIPPTNPVVSITSPANNAAFTSGTSISFRSTVTVSSGLTLSSIRWVSSRDGQLSTSKDFDTSGLTVGTHTITATATDSSGRTGSSSVVVKVNPAPTNPVVSITSPANNAAFTSGTSISFRSTVTVSSGLTLSSIRWVSSRDGQLSTSKDFDTSVLTTGTHTITATATDSSGRTGSTSVVVKVNPAPTNPVVSITSPANNAVFTSGTSIAFRSTVTVSSGLTLSSIRWVSSRDGQLSTSKDFDTSVLTTGTHTITATATDSSGRTGSASVVVKVNPAPTNPVVSITSPANNAAFTSGRSISFRSTVTVSSGLTLSSIRWVSSRDGQISASKDFDTSVLTTGTHTITATATDSSGRTGSASVVVKVNPAPTNPVVSITSPANNAVFTSGTSISFMSTVTVSSGLTLSSIRWVSSRDGQLSTSKDFDTSVLTTGTHTITATATDSSGRTGSASVVVKVNPAPTNPVVSITSPANNAIHIRHINIIHVDRDGLIRTDAKFNSLDLIKGRPVEYKQGFRHFSFDRWHSYNHCNSN